jgi:AraC-like DNA-binding protein
MQIVVNQREDRLRVHRRGNSDQIDDLPGVLVSGAQTSYLLIDRVGESPLLGIHFHPGGAYPFFKLPMEELANSETPLETLWGGDAAVLRVRLLEAKCPEHKFKIVEKVLNQHLTRCSEHESAVGFALRQLAPRLMPSAVSSVSAQIGMSWTRFIQVFREQVGLTPKTFCRIQRFQQALRQVEADPSFTWSKVATECGYYDQAHFIHDFRTFAGITPSIYVHKGTWHRNRAAVDD